ncbi:ATP-grasp domain-containing protein [Streptosporangium sp. NPDC001559]|uniref:ATP-grasp domain-containing protein n=1 Tax=Streptosporangium sp. NPDC001559 TaxID=3366187 RepID=UPI0036EF2B7E
MAHPRAGRPVLLLVTSRRRRFTRHLLERPDIGTVLLCTRATAGTVPDGAPCFVIDEDRPLAGEVTRYKKWASGLDAVPAYFCNPDETLQPLTHRFAAFAGLPHMTRDQVRLATDKVAMKELFAAAGLPAARWRVVTSAQEVRAFADRNGWPVVVKPAVSGSSVDVWRFHAHEMTSAARIMAVRPRRRWIVEEHVAGTEHQLCALVHRGEVQDAFVAVNPAPMLETLEGAMNADITLAPSEPKPLDPRKVAQRISDALGYRDGYLHAEFFLRPDGSHVMGEIAARLSGAWLPENHGLSHGFDMLAAVADVYVGRRPQLAYTLDRSVGDLLLPARRGRVLDISPIEDLLSLPGVISGEVTASVGDRLEPARASNACTGYLHIAGRDSKEVRYHMENALSEYRLVTTE